MALRVDGAGRRVTGLSGLLTGYLGLTFVTAGDERAAFNSPLVLPQAVDHRNLAQRVQCLRRLLAAMIDLPENGPQIGERKDSFGTLRGQVLSWGRSGFGPDRLPARYAFTPPYRKRVALGPEADLE